MGNCLAPEPQPQPELHALSNHVTNKRKSIPIPADRQQEADNHFGLPDHKVVKPLGTGGTGETFLVKRKDTGVEEAVKVLKRPVPKVLQKLLTQEISLQASIGEGHVSIVHSHSVLLTSTHLCLFMDFIPGGTLTDYVCDRADTLKQRNGLYLDEDEARYIFQQCIEALEYCHSRKVAHRDMKLDNTLLDQNDPPHVKICDFGFAKLMGGSNFNTNVGTPEYMSPANVGRNKKGFNGAAADIWACGVLLFAMLLGAFPFEASATATDVQRVFDEVYFEQIRKHWAENERNRDIVKQISADCVDLLDKIFKIKDEKRITIPEIKEHPWYTKPLPPRFAQAMAQVRDGQARQEALVKSLGDMGQAKQDELIKAIVAAACTPLGELTAQDKALEGQDVSLIRLKGGPTGTGPLEALREEEDAQ